MFELLIFVWSTCQPRPAPRRPPQHPKSTYKPGCFVRAGVLTWSPGAAHSKSTPHLKRGVERLINRGVLRESPGKKRTALPAALDPAAGRLGKVNLVRHRVVTSNLTAEHTTRVTQTAHQQVPDSSRKRLLRKMCSVMECGRGFAGSRGGGGSLSQHVHEPALPRDRTRVSSQLQQGLSTAGCSCRP